LGSGERRKHLALGKIRDICIIESNRIESNQIESNRIESEASQSEEIMSMPFVSVLPRRLPVSQNDLAGMLASWMDNSTGLNLSSAECQMDLERIDGLRKYIAESLILSETDDSEAGSPLSAITEKLHEYHHLLSECETHGMVQGGDGSEFLSLEWKSSVSIPTGEIQIAGSLESERANILWNLAALEVHQASKETPKNKLGWNKVSKRLQVAASWLGHLRTLSEEQPNEPQHPELSPAFVSLWQTLLLAQAQHCVYESVCCVKRPMHLLAAKLGAATVPLYKEVEASASTNTQQPGIVDEWARYARAWGTYMSCRAEYHQSEIHKGKKAWGQELARLEVAYQHAAICKAICDELSSTPTKLLYKLRTAVDDSLKMLQSRLEIAQRENTEQHNQPVPTPQELIEIRGEKLVKCDEPLSKLLLPKLTGAIFQRTAGGGGEATSSNAATAAAAAAATVVFAEAAGIGNPTGHNNYNHVAAKTTMLPPLPTGAGGAGATGIAPPPQLVSNPSSASFFNKKMRAVPSAPSVHSPNLKTFAEVFKVEMNEILEDLTRATEDETESARLALAEVHLPHSLTAYKQEQAGGGLPEELWQKVHVIQQENTVIQLKQDLWELRDAADLARATHKANVSQLDFDLTSDRKFREANPLFGGHSADEIQQSFRRPLVSYERLLSSAHEGDSVLFRRLEQLDIEPKYNLLQFSKSQLDRLLPGARRMSNDNGKMTVDTQHLTYLLGELSTLFRERANLVVAFRNEIDNFDILEALRAKVEGTKGTDHDFLEATKHARQAFDGIRYEIHANMERQIELLGTILAENEAFMNSRGERATHSQSADSCIIMIEDALEEIDQLQKHAKEGKDFYQVVNPKLTNLKQQVDDVSARLTVQRLEYGERERRASLERSDAEMAARLVSNESNTASPAGRANQERRDAEMAQSLVANESSSARASQERRDAEMAQSMAANESHSVAATPSASISPPPPPINEIRVPSSSAASAALPPTASSANRSYYDTLPSATPVIQNAPGAAVGAAVTDVRPRTNDATPSASSRPLPQSSSSSSSPAAAAASPSRTQSNGSRVDDEKVAILVAMEFDASKVVAALEKHNNNMDDALNELLSC